MPNRRPRYKKPERSVLLDDMRLAAQHLGMASRTFDELTKRGVLKPERSGKWSPVKCWQALEAYYSDAPREGEGAALNDLDAARVQKTRAEARIKELELDKLKGDLITKDSVRTSLTLIGQIVSSKLYASAAELAPLVAGKSTEEAQRALDEAFRRLAATINGEIEEQARFETAADFEEELDDDQP
jgi:hypothetical protein